MDPSSAERDALPDERLLANDDSRIVAYGDAVLVCECRGENLDLGVRLVATFALTVATIVTTLVSVRAVPWPLLFVSITWIVGATSALAFIFRRRRRHGLFRLDFARGELRQEGRGFQRTIPLDRVEAVTTKTVVIERDEAEQGLEPRWLLLCLKGGEALRLGKAPGYALRPAITYLRRAGIEVR